MRDETDVEVAASVAEKLPVRRTGVLKGVTERFVQTAGDALSGQRKVELPRRTVAFPVDCDICAPGVFDEDFELTLRASSPGEETRIARQFKNDPVGYQFALARASIHLFNGESIAEAERIVLWDVLDAAGRNLVMSMWQELAAPTEAALGKARRGLKVST